jgi:hypothetical protein
MRLDRLADADIALYVVERFRRPAAASAMR